MKNFKLIGIIAIIGIIAVLESPMMAIDPFTVDFYESVPVGGNMENEISVPNESMSLEKELVSKDIMDGYIVETYQEFEVYRDPKGEIVRSIPTSNYDYLRYLIEKPE